jgi:putative nucleotidyltransferase with HDIG domain
MSGVELSGGRSGGMLKRLLIVDDEASIRRLLRYKFEEQGWRCFEAESGRAALDALLAGWEVELILLDIGMPDMSGIIFLRQLKGMRMPPPVIVLSGIEEVSVVVEAIQLGAVDYILKPFESSQLEHSVRKACDLISMPLVVAARSEGGEARIIRSASDVALSALSSSLGAREEQTRRHSVRVSEYALRLARELGLPRNRLTDIRYGGLIHDVGKIGLPDSILLKPGPLTPEERRDVEQHSEIGQKLVLEIPELNHLSGIVLSHHERFDGRGYPNGVNGRLIPLGSRIIAVVDTYDSLTSSRPYRRTLTHAAAVQEIERCSGSQFDPEIVEAFFRIPQEELTDLRELANGSESIRDAYHAAIPENGSEANGQRVELPA